MITAALRVSLVIGAGVFAGASGALAADTARAVPSRPAAATVAAAVLPGKKIGQVEYVNLADLAAHLGLKFSWLEKGRKALLAGPGGRAEIEADTRDITVNGLRVFLGEPSADAGGKLYVSRIDAERCLRPALRPGHGVPPLPAPRTIALDPGHGGKDQGTSVNEKTYALDVARRAGKLLEAAGYRVVFTRDDDTFIDLAQRAIIANTSRADLFVSIHFNALANRPNISGVEVYTFPPANQHATEWWSTLAKEDPHLATQPEPGNRFDHWNVALAEAIHGRFVRDLKTFDRGKKLMHLGVLRGLNCPGMLVECGFLTSEQEARKIATPAYRDALAAALVAGISDYAATLEKLNPKPPAAATAPAPAKSS